MVRKSQTRICWYPVNHMPKRSLALNQRIAPPILAIGVEKIEREEARQGRYRARRCIPLAVRRTRNREWPDSLAAPGNFMTIWSRGFLILKIGESRILSPRGSD